MSDSTKGGWHRPHDRKRFGDNWDSIYGKKEESRARYIPVRKRRKAGASDPIKTIGYV